MTNWDWMRQKLQELAGEEKATPAVLKTLDEVLSELAEEVQEAEETEGLTINQCFKEKKEICDKYISCKGCKYEEALKREESCLLYFRSKYKSVNRGKSTISIAIGMKNIKTGEKLEFISMTKCIECLRNIYGTQASTELIKGKIKRCKTYKGEWMFYYLQEQGGK